MDENHIQTIERLREYLVMAMRLEHATIPPYLTALYSIRPQTNSDATHILRVVVVEEMLHLTLAANILNAVGGTPDLTASDFVPSYPTPLPEGLGDFQVGLEKFSDHAVDIFLKIERPRETPKGQPPIVPQDPRSPHILCAVPDDPQMRYYSIGEFYEAVIRGLKFVHDKLGDAMFSGDPGRQVTPEYYYSGGGDLFPVTDLASAVKAAELIIGQGEGFGGGIYDKGDELAHEYRFDQLKKGKYYEKGNEPFAPTGPPVAVAWDAVYPIRMNARVADYPAGSELHAAAVDFNQAYADFLGMLTEAFNGDPSLLLKAVPKMFELKYKVLRLMHNPIPGRVGENAAPTFEVAGVKP